MEYFLKLLNVSLIASIKYFWSTPYAFILNLNAFETFLAIEIGGIIGFLLYYYFFRFALKELAYLWPAVYYFTPVLFKVRFEAWRDRRRRRVLNRRKFTALNKFIIRIRQKYGMRRLSLLPVLPWVSYASSMRIKSYFYLKAMIMRMWRSTREL